jgi:hypothetical protein
MVHRWKVFWGLVLVVFAVLPARQSPAAGVYDRTVSLLGSAVVPVGELADISEPGYGAMAQFGSWSGPGHRLQGVFGVGYHSFGEKSIGPEGILSFAGRLIPV